LPVIKIQTKPRKIQNLKMKLNFIKIALMFIIMFGSLKSKCSDILEVLPLTNKIILVHFDDGSVTYPNTLKVNRLNILNAEKLSLWTFSSSDDADFQSSVSPIKLGRKSKGTEFSKDAPWSNTANAFDPRTKPWASEHWIYLIFDKELKSGKSYTLNTGTLAANGSEWKFVYEEKILRSEAVHVNTIGYAAKAPKYGYIYQWMGNLGNLNLSSYAGKKFRIYKEGTELPVKEGIIQKRKPATNAETSQTNDTPNKNFLGAEVLDCDFSDITAEGTYTLVVEGIGSSYPFRIGADAVWDAYYNVARGMYHQRSGIRLAPPYTATGYIRPVNQNTKVTSDDGTSFAGKLLYSDYSFMDWNEADGGGSSQAAIRAAAAGKTLDVAGWYHDAGDWDSYWTHQRVPMLLMMTWEFAPDRFGDSELNIPESGNGIPDLLDEASWLVKFNYRLRKELKSKGYSNGGVGGARICADVYTEVDGSTEDKLPSWKESRHMVVTKADAFMTYMYAGEAAQFACILKRLGKDPKNFKVEMLDNVDFQKMTKDEVNWITEAEEAYAWASAPGNQPAKGTNYDAPLGTYKMYAAANLYRLTGKEEYHVTAKKELAKIQSSGSVTEDQRWGVYSYLLTTNKKVDKNLQNTLKNAVITTANTDGISSANSRACRWGGSFGFPMLVGQGTTPSVFETIVAACITGEKKYEDVVHTTADYFLGTNPLHTTWMTGVGPRPAACGFHLDSRYNNKWVTYPGWIPYGPWSMAYGFTPYTWTIDGVSMQGGHGSWNKDWANFSMFPAMENWPGHERWNGNIHAPMSSENTVHQNAVYGALTYGFVNSRHYENATAAVQVGSISLDKPTLNFNEAGKEEELVATLNVENATFSTLKWTSSDPRVAYVDALGKVTAVNTGKCKITCSTLDGSVFTDCSVSCTWPEISLTDIQFNPESFSFFQGQSRVLVLTFTPENATNKLVNYSFDKTGIVTVDENDRLTALSKGVVTITATTLSGEKTATCTVTVNELLDYTIADFDAVTPVTTEPQPETAQLYTPDGTNDIAFANPDKGSANPSPKVVKWGRPAGDWKLIGIVLPTNHPQPLSQYSQFQFKYYGKGIKDFYIQIVGKNGTIDVNQNAAGEDCWKLFTYDLSSTDSLIQFNVFVNKTGSPLAINCYFDDFKLAGLPAIPFDGTTLSEYSLKIKKGEKHQLSADAQGNPFTWVSSDLAVARVDQEGNVSAVGGGITSIKAVPLYGNPVECIVTVEGAVSPVYKEEIFLDFETIVLDWTSGYGAFAWNSDQQTITGNPSVDNLNSSSKVYQWKRDISGNALWGGYGIVLPSKNTEGWERISFQVYTDKPVTSIRVELFKTDVSQGNYTISNLSVPANKWTTVSISMADLGMVGKTFDKIQMQIAGGSDVALITSYSDNFKFEKGTLVSVQELNANSVNVQIYPNPAKDRVIVNCPNGLSHIEIFDLSGKKLISRKLIGETTFAISKNQLKSGLYILKIIDSKENSYTRKLVFE
jgi:endoglucanase